MSVYTYVHFLRFKYKPLLFFKLQAFCKSCNNIVAIMLGQIEDGVNKAKIMNWHSLWLPWLYREGGEMSFTPQTAYQAAEMYAIDPLYKH